MTNSLEKDYSDYSFLTNPLLRLSYSTVKIAIFAAQQASFKYKILLL
ncbi:hypothetical protein FHX64_001423 [Microbacter margulisiae]|uniref:Uncharacterized protein n=1 Tax=Microbacter margulisiae TaxID=1350067 RepID=A0A7W5DR84_9PORP|nr:hypothetical protein [Microbacter margulisiae]